MTPLSSERGANARATIRDVARLAGVGTKTVSRVMNSEPNVAASTAERVRRAAAALQYVPDLAAGNLRRTDRRSLTLGLLVGDVTDPFFAEIGRAVEDASVARGFAVFTSSSDENEDKERSAVDAFLRRRVDGLLLVSASPNQAYLAAEQAHGMPIVCIDRPPVGLVADAVLSDNAAAAARATNHLLRHGHRRIAGLFDQPVIWTASERVRGFRAATDHLPDVDARIVMGVAEEEAATRAVLALLVEAEPPTALFTGRSSITIGAVRALRHLGLQHEIAVVGFDDLATTDLLEPAVTVVAQRPGQIGRLAVERLFARIDHSSSPFEIIEVAVDLIERGSGEIRPRG